MKKILYFLPAIIWLIIAVAAHFSDVIIIENAVPFGWFAMIFAGVVMCRGKVWGAVAGLVASAGVCLWDYIKWLETIEKTYPNGEVGYVGIPDITLLWPIILFYLICTIQLIFKSKNSK